ncbi:inositol 1,4,5-triphosphate receptor associated 2 [Brienomyrus brachyistius]|uniref:inositol 1,4,5-triphosphate receptor associated 2 n=1 Tax=Brienomyrus brachyistius TaxID=42636 RepID=UPI0020B38D93|nr:inositol 1,4,5-triphosphate receptor associated 2 [Brienomyrus brachyistius]
MMEEKPETSSLGEDESRSSVQVQEDVSHSRAAAPGRWSESDRTRCPSLSGRSRSSEVLTSSTKPRESENKLGESGEDSEEELSQEDPLARWENLPILDRLGLSSTEMTEKEMESTFLQLASAFRCDQHTLQKRLRAEEHARNVAEWNVQLELEQGRDALQALKDLCLDSKRSKILQRLELCLDVLAGAVQRITSTAEVLGAVHQEARVSHAVRLMMTHVEKLQWRHVKDSAELEEARRMVQRSNCSRQLSDPRDEGEMRQKLIRSGQLSTRRRVSVAVIPTSQNRSEMQTLPASPMANLSQLDSRYQLLPK